MIAELGSRLNGSDQFHDKKAKPINTSVAKVAVVSFVYLRVLCG
jgi:hypothetical protein